MQLPLSIDAPEPAGRLPLTVRPMHATDGDRPFDDRGYYFEPWWPGVRALPFVEAGTVRLQSEQLSDLLESFPELESLGDQLRLDGVVMDGTLLVLDDAGRPDPELLRRRLADRDASGGRAAFVATDLLYLDGQWVGSRPFSERRDRLRALVRKGETTIVGRGFREEGVTVAEALGELGMDAISARKLSARYRPGPAADAWLRVPIWQPAPRSVRPTLSVIQKLPL
ncbi:MAG: hypothetical protein M3295_03385 [Chloroflexota bacterium]|nr:hypothetical protein [Chloroflexota bacterium]